MIYCILCIGIFLILLGCHDTNGEEEEVLTMTEDELYDIYYIKEAPETKQRQDLSELIKIVVVKNENLQDETIAIDVQGNGIYIDPSNSSLGIRATKGIHEIDDMEKAIDILRKYNVQDWEEDYSTERDPSSTEDGVGWSLYLQFEDGTVEKHRGTGTAMKSITPEGFDDFIDELSDFVNERLENEND